ncbi:HpcH/HpaI aldolase/citrate lyase family protein [Aquidulcibacter paucihalophilus]|uniref:HpcH/HpaI aldolase/citrate lyase family protein n=1 Tax=Aquidulcibacter paucihalophilus TaxID=1978549 RepID=UPI000A18FDCF|nr:CoA ester lyase [Aquidulcibacter paucihalophilus]
MKTFRSLLFVPGSRPDRFEKALAAGADSICIDLEDAVPPQDKAAARAGVIGWLEANAEADPACAIGVRMNGLDTLDGLKDIIAFSETTARPDFLMVPKAGSGADLANLSQLLDLRGLSHKKVALWAVIESVMGLKNASDIAVTCGSSGGVLFGGADYSLAIGTAMDWDALFHARTTLATEARVANGSLMDVPYLNVKDEEGLRAECVRVKALGFDGKACIHPSQVAIVNEVFSPSEAELGWAKRVVAAGRSGDAKAMLLDGKLLDIPVYLRAERVLSKAGIEF